jgi:hypothetical protein
MCAAHLPCRLIQLMALSIGGLIGAGCGPASLDPAPAALSAALSADSVNTSAEVRAATSGTGRILVAWETVVDGHSEIAARFLDASGSPLSDVMQVSATSPLGNALPHVAFGNGHFVVIYTRWDSEDERQRSVHGVLYDVNGLLRTRFSFTTGASFEYARGVVFVPERQQFFVLADGVRDGHNAVSGAYISVAGEISSGAVTGPGSPQTDSRVAYGSGRIFVVGLDGGKLWRGVIFPGEFNMVIRSQVALPSSIRGARGPEITYNPTFNRFALTFTDDGLFPSATFIQTFAGNCVTDRCATPVTLFDGRNGPAGSNVQVVRSVHTVATSTGFAFLYPYYGVSGGEGIATLGVSSDLTAWRFWTPGFVSPCGAPAMTYGGINVAGRPFVPLIPGCPEPNVARVAGAYLTVDGAHDRTLPIAN